MFVQVYYTPPTIIQIQNIFKISFCLFVTVISLSHITMLISFQMALVPACRLISHTLAPHLALLLNMFFLDKLVPLLCVCPLFHLFFFQFSCFCTASYFIAAEGSAAVFIVCVTSLKDLRLQRTKC